MSPTLDRPTRPPGPRARYPGEFMLALGRDPLGFMRGLQRDYGDVARFRAGGREFVLLAHPDMVREVLVTEQKRYGRGYRYRALKLLLGEGLLTSEGAFHLRQRRLVQPAFHRERIAHYATAMSAAAERWSARWEARTAEAARAGTPATVDVADEMGKLALAIVSETLFGNDVTRDADAVARALDVALHSATPAFAALGRLAVHLPIPAARRFRRARADLDAVIYRLIDERRRGGGDGRDLLSLLLHATDTEGEDGRPAQMTDLQLRDEAMTLFLAGHETTANALAWTWYLLSQHPEVAERLRASLDEALEGRAPTMDDVPRLGYARQVLSESMRLYPPAYAIGRVALEDVAFGGHRVRARSGVLLSPWLVQRDPRWWPEPERFDPDRWAPGAGADRHRFAYFPFGAGTRICIGEQFAWTEALLVLATLAPRWRLALVPGARIEPEPIITLRPRFGIPMTLHAR
ncbi:MAG: cytochrome P450 [Gemmatirosa sp.]